MRKKFFKIAIIIAEHNLEVIAGSGERPIDGTTQASVLLARTFLKKANYDVYFVSSTSHRILNVRTQRISEKLDDFQDVICICPAIYQSSIVTKDFSRILVWVHHPHWRNFLPTESIDHIIYCGKFVSKLRPVYLKSSKVSAIYNLQQKIDITRIHSKNINFGHDVVFIGALIRSKGIIKFLNDVYSLSKHQKLDIGIIGSAGLYSGEPSDNEIGYFSHDIYATCQKLLLKIRSTGSVIKLYGSLGVERFDIMANSKVVVVNPTAISEALSTSILESYQLKVITLSGNRNGNRELIFNQNTYSKKNLKFWLNEADQKIIQSTLSKQRNIVDRVINSELIEKQWTSLIEENVPNRTDCNIHLNLLEKFRNLKWVRIIR